MTTPRQRALLAELAAARASDKATSKEIRRLVAAIVAEDDRTRDLRPRPEPGGRSRSPAFGRWQNDDRGSNT